ncbi:uncharacterized protein [Primulina huaijiensis]|uniref:uncharacterized protein n=1 Tax=Primulina huaijiensis TaxID=1492673 RepID=UPI003CC71555
MDCDDSTRESAVGGKDSSQADTKMANGAESLEDLNECESAGGSKKDDTSTSIVPSEVIIECDSAETEDNEDAAEPIFPPEVVIEILCWLPLRSLAKLQLICKEWRGFINGRYLMERNVDRREVICHWHNVVRNDDPTKQNPNDENFQLLEVCDGLLFITSFGTEKFTIWNPATRGVLHLPDHHKDVYGVTFNYVKSTGNYLVVSIYNDESGKESCEVFTPGQSESWRPLAFPDVAEDEGHRKKQRVQVVSTGEAVHTVLIIKVGSTVTKKVVSLDLETECFTVTCFTKTQFKNSRTLWAIDWNGKLALTTLIGNDLHVTELEDYKKQRWCQKDKVIPLSFLQEGGDDVVMSLVPLLAKDGDIWFICKEAVMIIYSIETGRSRPVNTSNLPPAGKMYPYKPTLVGLKGMQQDPEFGKRWSSTLKFG